MSVATMQTAPTRLADITVPVRKDLREMVARVQVNLLYSKHRTDNRSPHLMLPFKRCV